MTVARANTLFMKAMKSKGDSIDAFDLRRAIAIWDPADGYMGLAACLERACGTVGPEYDRVADRMVQKMRKEGVIRHLGKGKWEWTQ